MNTIKCTFLDSSLYGHRLIQPLLWYGHQVSQIFTAPFPQGRDDVIRRVFVSVLLALGSFFLLFIVPLALAGLAVKYQYLPPPSKKEASEKEPPPVKTEGEFPPVPSFIPPSEQTIQEANHRAQKLIKLLDSIKELDNRNYSIETLLRATQYFCTLYQSYRSPDGDPSDPMKKSFEMIESANQLILTLKESQDHYNAFYKRLVDELGEIQHDPDGNCWLSVALNGLQQVNHPSAGDLDIPKLRQTIVKWMRDNYAENETLRKHVETGIDDHRNFYIQQKKVELHHKMALILGEDFSSQEDLNANILKIEQEIAQLGNLPQMTHEQYFNHMEQDRSFGGYVEYFAFAHIFGVNVEIWREVRPSENKPIYLSNEYDVAIIVKQDGPRIYPVMTIAGNHFNSKIPPMDINKSFQPNEESQNNGSSSSSSISSSSSCSSLSSSNSPSSSSAPTSLL